MMPFSRAIEQERRRWMPLRRALSKEDQEAFDRMVACAKQHVQAAVLLGRPWGFEAVLMAVVLEHETRIGKMLRQLEALKASPTPCVRHWGGL
jgi:hypothetical protein